MQSSYLAEAQSMRALTKRRKISTVFSTQPLQPALQFYAPQQQLNILIQQSKSFIDFSSGIQLFYRPIIKYNFSSFSAAQAAQIALLGITPIDSENCFFNMSSITLSGTQILAQPQVPQLHNRARFMAYYNEFTFEEKNHLTGKYVKSMSNYCLGGPAQNKMGYEELALTSPYGQLIAQSTPGNCNFDSQTFPRAIMSRMYLYNADCNIPSSATTLTYFTNSNFAQNVTINGDAQLSTAASNTSQGSVISPFSLGVDSKNVFPLIQSSPGIQIYKQQQERFQQIRMRFLTCNVSAYNQPIFLDVSGQQSQIMGSVNTSYYNSSYIVNQNTAAMNNTPLLDSQQRSCFGYSIQNQIPNNYQRSTGTLPSETQCTYFQNEQFTMLSCRMGALSLELQDIGLLCMDNISACLTLTLNLPENVLSSYLPANNFYGVLTGQGSQTAPVPITQEQVQTYLQGCQLAGKASYVITDCIVRLEYQHYPEESYPIMRSLMHQPKAFDSIRVQVDNIPSSQLFTQRIALGNSTLLKCVFMFIVPNQVQIGTKQVSVGLQNSLIGSPQDQCVNPFGCQPPALGDLRNTYLNSYYMPFSTASVLVDGVRYNSTDCNIADPALAAYLVSSSNIQTCFPGKYLDIELREYLANRYVHCIAVNPYADLSQQIMDQQITITLDINSDSRVQSSTLWNESTKSIANRFSLLTFAVVSQSLVNGTEVRIQ